MAALKELQIELLSITPKEVVQEDLVTTSPYVMELRCDYHQFAQLLDAIERCNDLMQITKFDLVAVREEVVATLSVDIHLFVGNDES
jgi:Tfp pilus assembly protein PilO